ncbi:MAG: acyltransferase family protein [Steroidobacteraceae bacterium]
MSEAASSNLSRVEGRIPWVDYAKGICIFMVLMLHAATEVRDARGDTGWIGYVVAFAKPFRMPDFFLIAGLFLSNVIDRPWKTYLDRKVVHFLYFYLLWTGIHFVLFGIKTALNASGGDWSTVLPAYLLTFIQPGGSLWFIHSLALYFLIVRLCKPLPWWLPLGATAILQMMSIDTGWQVIDEFCRRFVYFYSGYLFARYVFQLADWAFAHRRLAITYLCAWAVLNQVFVARGWSILPGVGLLQGYFGAMAVVFCAVLLSAVSWTKPLRYIGATSIVLYLGDYVVQRVALKLGVVNLFDPGTAALLLTFISVCGTLLMFKYSRYVGFGFLYRRPAWARLEPAKPPASDVSLQARVG